MKTVADIRAFPQGPGFGFVDLREVTAESGGTIRVDDAALLFRGHYVRDGSDLIVSDESHRLVVHDYFEVGRRPKLVAPDGATLSDAVIAALSLPLGGEQHAQAGAPQASDASPAIGRVQTVTGTATVVRNGVTVTLHVGDLVFKGDVVQTERGSSLAISFLDGTLFSLSASARMLLNDMVYKADGEGNSALFSLVQGSITFVAGKVAKTGDMKVSTPVATMGIRGTAVSVQIDADNGTTRLSVMTEPDGHTGRFEVFDRDDPSRLLFTVSDPGQAFVVSPNGPLQVKFEQVAKTPADFQAEAAIVQALFKTIAEAPRLPVFQGPSTGGGGGSSTEPNIVQPDSGPPAGSGTPNGPNGTPPVDPLSGTDSRGSGSAPAQTPQTGPSLPGGSTETDSLVLTPHTFTVVQGNALVAATVGQGVLGATAALIVAARAGAEPPMDGLSGGAVTLQGRYGTLWLREDGTYVYRADKAAALAEGQQGADVFTYRVQDRTGATATTTLTMDVTGVNDAPVSAGPVALAAAGEDQVHLIARADLLAGASDVDGDALQVIGLRVESGGGTIEDLGDGHYAYRPAQDASGPVTLSYTVTDGHGGSVTQTVQFAVTPVNDSPMVRQPLALPSSAEDAVRILTAADLLGGASDVDGDVLQVIGLRVESGGGTIEDFGDGRYAYRPEQDTSGPVTLSYTIEDGHGGRVTQTVEFAVTPVNDAPMVRQPLALSSSAEDTVRILTAADLLAGASDIDGAALQVMGLRVESGGTIEDLGDGRFAYRPAQDASGPVALAYTITDGHGGSVAQTVQFDVTPVNDAPIVRQLLALPSSAEDTVRILMAADLLAGASDVDGDALQVTGLRVERGGGTIKDLGDGRFAYRPAQDASGPVALSYTIADGHGGSVTQTVEFAVTPVNDAPTVSGPVLIGSVLEDTARILRLDELLAGARDAEGDPLAVTDLIVADGGGTIEDLGDGRFVYRPARDANGPVMLAYAVTDGHGGSVSQTAQLTLTPVNDVPVIRADATGASAAVTELRPNAAGAGTVLHTRTGTIAFADPDAGDVHAVTLTPDHAGYLGSLTLGSVDAASGTVGWTFTVPDGALDFLDEGETRLQTYTVLIADGHGGSVSQTITVTLTGSREGPVAVDDPDLRPSLLTNSGFGATPDFAGWTTSTANSGNFLSGFYSPQVFVDRTGTHLSGADAAAVLAFTGTINRAGGTAWGPSIRSATFTAEAGDEIKFDWQLSSGEDHARGRGYLRDASNGQIVATVLEENSNVSGTTGLQTKTFVLPAGGSYYIEFQVGSYDSTFGYAVGAELVIDYAGVVPRIREDKPLVIQAADLLANDGDPSGLPIHLVSVAGTSAQGGSVRLNLDGSITYDPGTAHFHLGQGETATDSFVYTIANSAGDTATATASFTVTGVNDAPTGGNDHILGTSDTLLFVPKSALLFNDSDPDAGDRLSVAGVTGAPLSAAGDGVLLTGTGNGEHVSYTLRDEHGAQAVQAVQAVVNRSASTDLVGTANDEILVAAETTESLTGGGGRDVFVFASAAASHRITDFAAGAAGDAIDLTGLFGSDVVHENLGAFARIVATDGHLALQVGDGSGTSWHTLADLANLPADSAAEVTLIWTDHLARLTTQVPLV